MTDRRKYPHLAPQHVEGPGGGLVPAMSREILMEQYGQPIPVPGIEGGTITLLDVMGDDQAIIQSARTSYGKDTSEHKWIDEPHSDTVICSVCSTVRDVEDGTGNIIGDDQHCTEGDRRLIRYLVSHRHTTPIEACEIKLHVKLPIFVERQWARHRTAGWNEMSGRYKTLDQGFYVATKERLAIAKQSSTNKQGSEAADWTHVQGRAVQMAMASAAARSDNEYRRYLGWGMSRELARVNMPVSAFTVKVWKIDLHNLIHFLGLRLDPHAQWEIRQYAEVIARIVRDWCPLLWEAVYDYRLEAAHFSRMELAALRELIANHNIDMDADNDATLMRDLFERHSVGSKRERGAFLRKIGVID